MTFSKPLLVSAADHAWRPSSTLVPERPLLSSLVPLSVALLLQAGSGGRAAGDTTVSATVRDTSRTAFRRIPVTAEHLATAYEDARARALLLLARAARLRQDSSLVAYDAKAYQRVSLGMGLKVIGRERLFLRHEAATRVRWQRGDGALIDVIGSRYVFPAAMGGNPSVDDETLPAIPYYPGRDDLWFGIPASAADNPHIALIHPIADGAEAYYRYSSGDSATLGLADGSTVRVVELRVRPREPSWRLAVGSLWFDASTAQLVRAVYRLGAPVDLSRMLQVEGPNPRVVRATKALLQPMTGNITSLVIENGLHEGRFWLPRAQIAEAEIQVSFARIPMRMEERFEFLSVNGALEPLPEIPRLQASAIDSLRADSLGLNGDARRTWLRERARERLRAYKSACDDGAEERTRGHSRHDGAVPVLVRMPCDTVALMTSPELPPSIFDESEELMTRQDIADVQRTLGFGAQAAFSPQRPAFYYGPTRGLLRYNRVEGLSAGLGLRSELGAGLALQAQAQIGSADLEPNGELSFERTDGTRTVRVGGYRRLAVANDWGTPLSFGPSLNAFLFGLDEGFYYRALGAELVALGRRDSRLEWRLFAERHDAAMRETHFSLAHAMHGLEFAENIDAEEGTLVGAGARLTQTIGIDPRGVRLFGDLRLDGGAGDFAFARGALDLTLSRSIGDRLAGALTVGGGSTIGEVPVQRLFFLGGTQTVRGQRAGTAAGNAYWLGRAELGTSFSAARPVIFYDLGWAGDRTEWRHPGRPMSGVGAGVSLLDGLVRFDLARGLQPRERWTASLRLDALF